MTFKLIKIILCFTIFIVSCYLPHAYIVFSSVTSIQKHLRGIVFESNSNIYVIDEDGSNQENLTKDDNTAMLPYCSPAGDKIAFLSKRTGHNQIFMMNTDGSDQKQLTHASTTDLLFKPLLWSSDGKSLTFAAHRVIGFSQLYLVSVDNLHETMITDSYYESINPIWSPDGGEIAFRCNFKEPQISDHHAVCIVKVAPVGEGMLKKILNQSAHLSSWSPDGQQIAFFAESHTRSGEIAIFLVLSDGSRTSRLTEFGFNRFPMWSPDGKKIAFVSTRDGNQEIHVINSDGSGRIRLTNDDSDDTLPFWSPDGEKIGFISNRYGNYEVYVMNADGSQQKKVTTGMSDESAPCWVTRIVK